MVNLKKGKLMKKILIVDDENSLRTLVSATLEGGRCKILQAKNGQEAIEIALKEKPNLIILDLMMPVMTGLEALEVIRKTEGISNTPVVVLSAKGHLKDREKALKAGATTYLTKPFSPLDLLKVVEEILDGVKKQVRS